MAGSVTVSEFYSPHSFLDMRVLKLACTGDSVDGSVPDTSVGLKAYFKRHGGIGGTYVDRIELVDPGGTAPDASWDITIEDGRGFDILVTDGVGLGNATYAVSSDILVPVIADLTIKFANQGTASATWEAYIHFSKRRGAA